MRVLSATKPATPIADTRRFQVLLRSSIRGFVIVGLLSEGAEMWQGALPACGDEEECEEQCGEHHSKNCRLPPLFHRSSLPPGNPAPYLAICRSIPGTRSA